MAIDAVKRLREVTFCDDSRQLRDSVYGLDQPIMNFITRDGKYSEEETNDFIDKVLGDDKTNDYLRAYLYMAIRTATTGFERFYREANMTPALSGPDPSICKPGEEKTISLSSLCSIYLPECACFLYRDLFPDADEDIVEDIVGYGWPGIDDDPGVWDVVTASYDSDSEFYDPAIADPPDIEYTAEDFAQMSDEEDAEWEQNTLKELDDDYWKQVRYLKHIFPEKEHFRESVEKYYSVYTRMKGNKVPTGWTHFIIEEDLKSFLTSSPIAIFNDRDSVARINAKLLNAKAIADNAERD